MGEQGEHKREEMKRALAESFGFASYEEFRRGVADRLGEGVLRRLEKRLQHYEGEDAGVEANGSRQGSP